MNKIFVDMDEVVAGFYEAVCALYDVQPWPYPFPIGAWDFFLYPPIAAASKDVKAKADRQFYAEMPKTAYADRVMQWAVEKVGKQNVFFLSAPWHNDGCCDGKRLWVRRHYPDFVDRTVLVKDKTAAAFPGALLLDDNDKNCSNFRTAGGRAILLPRPWNQHHSLVAADGTFDLESVLCSDF